MFRVFAWAVAFFAVVACGQAADLSVATQAPTVIVTSLATSIPSPIPTQAFFRSTPSATPAPTNTRLPAPTRTATRLATATTLPPTPLPPTATPEPATATPTSDPCPGAISWDQAISHIGTYVTVIGPVVGTTWASTSRGQPTFLNLGLPYPDLGRFTVLIWIDGRWNFPTPPEETYAGHTICVTGTIELYEGSAEMVVDGPWQITIAQ